MFVPKLTPACRALFALFALGAPLCLSAPLEKRSDIDTTLRLGRPLSPTPPPGSATSSRSSTNGAEFREGKVSHAAADPFPLSKTKFFRPFSLGGFGIEGRQTDRPLAGAFRIYTPPAQAVTTLHIAVDKAPDPGTSRTLVSPKAGTKPRVKKTTRLWMKLESNDKPVDVSTSGPSTSGSVVLKAAPIVNQDLEVPKQPTDHVKPSLTPWSYYRSNYFKQSPPKLFFRNVLMSQASLRIQARIEALQAAKT